MMNQNILPLLTEKVREQFAQYGADHDFYHIERVVKLAEFLQKKEGGDLLVIQCAALLHDISDHKLNGGIKNDCARVSRIVLTDLNANSDLIKKVCEIVDLVSYKGANVPDVSGSIELSIVRDADRLDAIGAIGIARAFHFGGSHNRPFFIPNVPANAHESFNEYSNDKSHTINHFYEKLLLLSDRLETNSAKEIGRKRHELMEQFIVEFHKEWNVDL
jgi:uncharacterized protein